MATIPPLPETNEEIARAPLGGTRAQGLQRLQVGLSLLLGIVLVVGLAHVIEERANQSADAVAPEAAATVAPDEAQPPGTDPLADAGVVPDLPAEPTVTGSAPARSDAGQ